MQGRKRQTIGGASEAKKKPLVDEHVSSMTHSEVRTQLEALGDKPGPIDDSNRDLYDRLLTKKWATATEEREETEETEETITPAPPTPPKGRRGKKGQAKPKEAVAAPKKASKTPKSMRLGIEGVVAATFTPFDADGSLNLAMVEPYANHLIKFGVAGVFVNGTTGEGIKMTVAERKLALEAWVKSVRKRTKIIVHVGSTSLKESQEMALHAASLDVDAIASMVPIGVKACCMEDLLVQFESIASSAPRTPIYLYHFPEFAPVAFQFDLEEFLRRAETRLPTFAGVKYTNYNLDLFARCLNLNGGGKYDMLYGRDEQLLASLAMGGVSCVGSTYNFTGSIAGRVIDAYKKGDMTTAQKEQYKLQLVIQTYGSVGGPIGASSQAIGKAIMHMIGCPVGQPRLPSKPLPDAQYRELKRKYDELGFFDWL